MANRLTEPEIFEAADSLLAQGLRPTIERVRQRLGRGSPNTVNRVLDDWWATLSQRITQKTQTLPPAIEDACKKLLVTLKAEAGASAAGEIGAATALLSQAQAALAADRARLESEQAGISILVTALREDLGKVGEANRVAARGQARLEAELAGERQKTMRLQKEAEQAAQARNKAENRLQADLERLRAQSQAAENKWMTEIDRLRDELKRQRADSAGQATILQGKLDKAEGKITELEKSLGTERQATSRQRVARVAAEARLAGKAAPRSKRTPVSKPKH